MEHNIFFYKTFFFRSSVVVNSWKHKGQRTHPFSSARWIDNRNGIDFCGACGAIYGLFIIRNMCVRLSDFAFRLLNAILNDGVFRELQLISFRWRSKPLFSQLLEYYDIGIGNFHNINETMKIDERLTVLLTVHLATTIFAFKYSEEHSGMRL